MENSPDYETVDYHLVYSTLIQAARHRGTVTYQELALLVGLLLRGSHMGRHLGWILGTISQNEVNHNRPLLSSLCVTVNGDVGGGFFPFARELGLLDSDNSAAERAFWEDQKLQLRNLAAAI